MTLLRKCVSCGRRNDKFSMIRINKSPTENSEKKIIVFNVGDFAHTNGRCAYICCNLECLKRARKSFRIDKSLKYKIDSKIYDTMEKMISASNMENTYIC